jgi:hypothetical protein
MVVTLSLNVRDSTDTVLYYVRHNAECNRVLSLLPEALHI